MLEEVIKLRSSAGKHLKEVKYSYIPDYMKSIGYEYDEDNLLLHFDKALLSEEKDEIANIVNSLNDDYDLVKRDRIKKGIIKDKMAFGHDFMAMFAANNEYRNKTAQQIGGMLAKYPALITCCLTGSIESLYGLVLTMKEDEFVTQEEIDEFKLRLEIYLGGLSAN